MNRVIIYRLGSLGDTVAALPCFHLIERAYPDAERVVLTNVPVSSKAAPLESVLKAGGFIHGSIPYPRGTRDPARLAHLGRELRVQRAHTLVYLAARASLSSAWRDFAFFKLCGIDKIIGAPLEKDLQDHRVGVDGALERESHRLARTLRDLGAIDLDDRSWWDLRLTESEHEAADVVLSGVVGHPFLAVNTGGKALEKDWGIERWKALLGILDPELSDWGLIFVGGREDRERAAELGSTWRGPTLDLCGRLNPRESAAALKGAALFVGHDSGPFHLADAVGTPALGIFGNYNRPRMWHPSGPQTRVIHQMSGLADITPAEVASEALRLVAINADH